MRQLIALLIFATVTFQAKSQTKWTGTYELRDTGFHLVLKLPKSMKQNRFILESLTNKPTRIVTGNWKQVGDTLELWPTDVRNAPVPNAVNKRKYLARLAYINGQLQTDMGQLVPPDYPTVWMAVFKKVTE